MNTATHAIFTLVLAALLFPFFGWKALVVFASGVLIDVDHLLWYAYKTRSLSPFKCYKYYTDHKNKWKEHIGFLHIFHTIEFFVIIIAAAFYNEYALIFLIGLAGHYLLDLIWHLTVPKRVLLDHSIIHWIYLNMIKRQKTKV